MKMKRLLIPLAFPAILFIVMANKGGSQGGFTGSPGDKNSTCTKCHNGTAKSVTGWISSDVPGNGYVPGDKYTITLTASDAFASRFGFEITAEDQLNNKAGVFTITNPTETKLTNASRAVTHTSSGISPTGNQRIWNFDWTAPAANAGSITFYAAVNAANGNGNTSGDVIYKTNMVISPSTTGIIEISDNLPLYPNPARDYLCLRINEREGNYTVLLINSSGRIAKEFIVTNGLNYLNVSELQRGVYFIKIPQISDFQTKKLILY
jgi:hypothetical protein